MSRKYFLEQACEAGLEVKVVSEQFLLKSAIAGKFDSCVHLQSVFRISMMDALRQCKWKRYALNCHCARKIMR
ncbi:hypothetical protein [Marinilabilia sp.]|uniref:hypothetical protein n=1 Tax=Marinilabilia sp. TaxID=2021252 RepID=UPI0025BF85DC|nr:hypothetical protein [Marinilabilia sp.]